MFPTYVRLHRFSSRTETSHEVEGILAEGEPDQCTSTQSEPVAKGAVFRRAAGLALCFAAALTIGYLAAFGKARHIPGGSMRHLVGAAEEVKDGFRMEDYPNASFIRNLPIMRTEARSTTVAPKVPCEYGPAEDGDSSCPPGSAAVTEAECRAMPYFFGSVLHNPFVVESNDDPWGCFLFKSKFYYNSGYLGEGRKGRVPFCKRCQVISPVKFAGTSHWSWGAYMIHRASSRFSMKRRSGGCRDQGLKPISDQATCELAAKSLTLPEASAALTCLEERPEGCYYLKNHEDGKGMLFLNINPLSKGNGAETSAFEKKVVRLPICSFDNDEDDKDRPRQPDSQAMASVCQAETAGVRKITKGNCKDIGREPILDADSCEDAANRLALADTTVEMTKSPHRPRGCYYFRNPEDLTSTLWLNTIKKSFVKGADSLRHPICAAPAHEVEGRRLTHSTPPVVL